jgi:hypothetical protein
MFKKALHMRNLILTILVWKHRDFHIVPFPIQSPVPHARCYAPLRCFVDLEDPFPKSQKQGVPH